MVMLIIETATVQRNKETKDTINYRNQKTVEIIGIYDKIIDIKGKTRDELYAVSG